MKYDLPLATPVLNSAGSLGFAPDQRSMLDLSQLGALITNPISMRARVPTSGSRLLTFSGGYLLHTGYPNPGFKKVIRSYASRWARAPLPVWVHLLAENPDEVAAMVKHLESIEGVGSIELGIPPTSDEQFAHELVTAAIGELPIVVRLPLEQSAFLALALKELPIAAFSLGPPYGTLPNPDRTLVRGRLYGPAVFPLALKALQEVTIFGLPVIAAGGILTNNQVETMLLAGALAVQLDAILWCGKIPEVSTPPPCE